MQISSEAHLELLEVVEDTVEYACDHHRMSGEAAWTIVQALAIAKLAQLEGVIS